MELLSLERGDQLVRIGAYCLMPNHFHLLLTEQEEAGISSFMQKLSTGYTMYFNKRNERTGVLFQGKYKSKHADEDRYLKYLISYIHLNPEIPHDAYSSYLDYMGHDRIESVIIDRGCLPDYFPTPELFEKEMKEWLNYSEELN
jgi:putative transposase